MNQLPKIKQTVQLDNGKNCTVQAFLGSGGQGGSIALNGKASQSRSNGTFPNKLRLNNKLL